MFFIRAPPKLSTGTKNSYQNFHVPLPLILEIILPVYELMEFSADEY